MKNVNYSENRKQYTLTTPINRYIDKDDVEICELYTYANKIIKTFNNKKCKDIRAFNPGDIAVGLIDRRSFLDDRGLWHVFPVAFADPDKNDPIPSNRTSGSVAIICPICHRLHWHGVKVDENGHREYAGGRMPHCSFVAEHIGQPILYNYTIEDISSLVTGEYTDMLSDKEYSMMTNIKKD